MASGDINGDGVSELVVGTGANPTGGPQVRVFDGATGGPLISFQPFDAGFRGGVRVAVGDVNGDGTPDLITASGVGDAPRVVAYDGRMPSTPLFDVAPFESAFRGGVHVAAGDLDGDGRADVIVGAGPGGGPRVRVLNGTGLVVEEFEPYSTPGPTGVFVAAGDFAPTDPTGIVVGPAGGGAPQVRIVERNGSERTSFFAYDPAFTGGVRVAAGDVTGDGVDDTITSPVGAAAGGPRVRVFDGAAGGTQVFEYDLGGPVGPGGVPQAAFVRGVRPFFSPTVFEYDPPGVGSGLGEADPARQTLAPFAGGMVRFVALAEGGTLQIRTFDANTVGVVAPGQTFVAAPGVMPSRLIDFLAGARLEAGLGAGLFQATIHFIIAADRLLELGIAPEDVAWYTLAPRTDLFLEATPAFLGGVVVGSPELTTLSGPGEGPIFGLPTTVLGDYGYFPDGSDWVFWANTDHFSDWAIGYAIPEPGTYAAGLGLAALLAVALRRRMRSR